MPIVTIHAHVPSDTHRVSQLLEAVRDQGAKALQSSPDNVWVLFQPISPGFYIQGLNKPAAPFVIIQALTGRSEKIREAFVKEVANAVAGGLSVSPKEVWIHYQEMNHKDVWSEGHFLSRE